MLLTVKRVGCLSSAGSWKLYSQTSQYLLPKKGANIGCLSTPWQCWLPRSIILASHPKYKSSCVILALSVFSCHAESLGASGQMSNTGPGYWSKSELKMRCCFLVNVPGIPAGGQLTPTTYMALMYYISEIIS